MHTPIRMGVIGLGSISGAHIDGINRSPDAVLWAICDNNPDALAFYKEKYSIPEARCFSDYRALIASPEVDAVSNCTPNDVHKEVLLAALSAGKPIATEKPLTLNSAEAEEAMIMLQSNPVPHMVCFSYRFKTAARYARKLIRDGQIGKVRHVYAKYLQAWGENAATPLLWRFNKSRTGTGALGDLGSHAMDLVRFLTGEEYLTVSAQLGTLVHSRQSLEDYRFVYSVGKGRELKKIRSGAPRMEKVDVDDYAHVHTRMTGDVSAAFEISRFGFGRGNYQYFEIYGSKGALLYTLDGDDDHTDKLQVCIGDFYGSNHLFREVPLPHSYKADQMQSFFNLLLGQGDGLTASLMDGLVNMRLMDACVRSSAEGREILLPS
ncbi:MAG: Gfo/Idh/MocA family protein [Christensenellales bacterium]|jgi:predicted dehydrogenase